MEHTLPSEHPSVGFLTDHYELTMLDAALNAGVAQRKSIFEVFSRHLAHGRRYGILAGTGRLLELLPDFRFTDAQLKWLDQKQIVGPRTIEFLADYQFTGNIQGYREGDAFFPNSPVLVVEGTFAEAVVLETLILSVLNFDTAIASAASRMVQAAQGRPCLEMGSRRAHEYAAVAGTRAAYIAGFSATSNLEAGFRWGIPTIGTAAHAFTLLFDDEKAAFQAQIDTLGKNTTLLVDTYDVPNAVRTAVELAGDELGAVRIDSGDLLIQASQVRAELDKLGAHNTKIVVTNDLDEYAIASLISSPVDSFGVGTNVITGSGVPTASFVYKLVARENETGVLTPVAKKSRDKASIGGRKWAYRTLDTAGKALSEDIWLDDPKRVENPPPLNSRELAVSLVEEGVVDSAYTGEAGVRAAREATEAALQELPHEAFQLQRGIPVIPTHIHTA